ncbi:MAG: ABC transporter ATP-binding protein/permease [Lachnospiraceae bacterium]|nr:ABC transporter ATP-binding protein/permease [Lachnospiraceae bacterium]
MKNVLSYVKGLEWLYLGIFLVLVYVQVFLSLKVPEYMTSITDVIQQGVTSPVPLIYPATIMFLCTVASVICAVVAGYCLSYASATVIMRMRGDLFRKIMAFNLEEMKNFSTSSLITRCTNDIEQVRLFISAGLQAIVQCPLTVIIAVSKMQGYDRWTNAVITFSIFLAVATAILFSLSVKKTAKLQNMIDHINRLTKEHLTGMRVVHAYNGYDLQEKQFESVNDELTKTGISAFRFTGSISPFFGLSMNGLTLAIYVLGSYMIYEISDIVEKQALFSKMVVFASYALQAFSAFAMIIMLITIMPRFIISLRRIQEVLDTTPAVRDGLATVGANMSFGSLEFRNVSFAYPGSSENVLSDISFKVGQGETLAIIGPTGSGKTTLMNLIPRFYDVTKGAVFVDGRDVRDYNLWALRDKIGYVTQKSFLFSGTIGYNIDYGQKSGLINTLEEIKRAAEIGQSREFIEKKSGGFEARVEEGGSNFSGGQRQRLTISRAVCRDPEFYLFDDSFSALDFKTDSKLRKELRENAKDSTQIIVGQRIGSIMNADIILVMEGGRIVGQGKHEELLENCPTYREIAMSQLSFEEVSK